MSEFVIDDWKLKARTVVKLYRKNTYMLVSGSLESKVLFYVKIHVKLSQVFTILREYSCNVRSAKFHI